MTYVAGVDGCKAGWAVALRSLLTGATSHVVVPSFADLLALPESPAVMAVDVPIGLLDAAVKGGRACDRLARSLLGLPRRNSVFSSPVRGALCATTFPAACAANRRSSAASIGISQQVFGLFPKLREVDTVMSAALQARIFEVHPELCFYEMAGGRAATHAKKTAAGKAERRRRLQSVGFWSVGATARGVAEDDVVDALAACWTAARIYNATAIRIPDPPPTDARGLRMELWR